MIFALLLVNAVCYNFLMHIIGHIALRWGAQLAGARSAECVLARLCGGGALWQPGRAAACSMASGSLQRWKRPAAALHAAPPSAGRWGMTWGGCPGSCGATCTAAPRLQSSDAGLHRHGALADGGRQAGKQARCFRPARAVSGLLGHPHIRRCVTSRCLSAVSAQHTSWLGPPLGCYAVVGGSGAGSGSETQSDVSWELACGGSTRSSAKWLCTDGRCDSFSPLSACG